MLEFQVFCELANMVLRTLQALLRGLNTNMEGALFYLSSGNKYFSELIIFGTFLFLYSIQFSVSIEYQSKKKRTCLKKKKTFMLNGSPWNHLMLRIDGICWLQSRQCPLYWTPVSHTHSAFFSLELRTAIGQHTNYLCSSWVLLTPQGLLQMLGRSRSSAGRMSVWHARGPVTIPSTV